MGVLTQDMRDILASAMLAFVATVRRDDDPRIEINSVDFIRRRGYRFAGTAQVLESGHPIYAWGRAWL